MHKSDVFKKLTSGLDSIDGEYKYQHSFKFRNTAKLVFSANVLPEGKQDKAYYRRWILINFPNSFEGDKDDKSLITKLREPTELSGFANLALEGLKRLKENGKFSHDKSIEETQKEYEFNSNPVKTFMDECTKMSDYEDCDAISLYLEYVFWCKINGIKHMANNVFSKKLYSMDYTSYRENIPGTNCTKKIHMWHNLTIKKDWIGQVRTGSENVNNLSYPVANDTEKTEIGQDTNPFVVNKSISSITNYNNSLKVMECSNDENLVKHVSSLTMDLSCPNMHFSDISSHRTGYQDNIENHPVQEQKTINSEQSNEGNILKKDTNIRSLRTDLKNLVRSKYNGVVESVPDLLNDFTKLYPGYKQILDYQDLQNEAEKLNSWGWT